MSSGPEADFEEAGLEGDLPYAPGTARAALSHRDYRVVWLGMLASNVGTWMQNVALGVFAWELSHSAGFVAFLGFAQLGPTLFFAPVGGALADALDRRAVLVIVQLEQLVLSFLLAAVAAVDDPSRSAVVACVFAFGIGNSIQGPALSSILPTLVPKRDLTGAVALQAVQMNLSRVVGPAIGGLLLPAFGPAAVFAINGLTYLFAVAALLAVRPPRPPAHTGGHGWQRLVGGVAVVRGDIVVRRCLFTITAMSLFCLPFIGLMPVLAARSFGIDPESTAYGVLYACFGLGAALGAIAVGTVLVGRPRPTIVRVGLVGFGLALGAFALLRSPPPTYPVGFLIGFAYFTTVTSLQTTLQSQLDEHVRGRVMALWMMGFGGTVPLGLLAAGAVVTRTNLTAVILFGAGFALFLAALTDLSGSRASRGRAPTRR